jgi:hypothetical protein
LRFDRYLARAIDVTEFLPNRYACEPFGELVGIVKLGLDHNSACAIDVAPFGIDFNGRETL